MQPDRKDYPADIEGHRAYKRAWYKANKKEVAAKTRAWRDSHLGRNPTRERPDCCEACGRLSGLVYDHDHVTGQFRGWLCNPCNGILGVYGDDPEKIRNLLKYLEGR